MFEGKKRLRQIETEKQELLFIKQQLEYSTPKIDTSNVYVWKYNDIYSIVRLEVQKIRGRCIIGLGSIVDGYESTLIDIFSNKIIYHKQSIRTIARSEYISQGVYAYLLPLYEVDRNLLAYPNKQVPLYILQQLYYRLNRVDVKQLQKNMTN